MSSDPPFLQSDHQYSGAIYMWEHWQEQNQMTLCASLLMAVLPECRYRWALEMHVPIRMTRVLHISILRWNGRTQRTTHCHTRWYFWQKKILEEFWKMSLFNKLSKCIKTFVVSCYLGSVAWLSKAGIGAHKQMKHLITWSTKLVCLWPSKFPTLLTSHAEWVVSNDKLIPINLHHCF